MLKEKMISISLICFSVSMIISAIIISSGMKSNGESLSNSVQNMSTSLSNSISQIANSISKSNSQDEHSVVTKRQTYDLATAAAYLGINQSQLVAIIEDRSSAIPYIKLNNEYVFYKDALDKWMETARVDLP